MEKCVNVRFQVKNSKKITPLCSRKGKSLVDKKLRKNKARVCDYGFIINKKKLNNSHRDLIILEKRVRQLGNGESTIKFNPFCRFRWSPPKS